MAVPPITNLATPTATTSQVANPTQTLGQSDFLKLLVTQMTSQDPLNPQNATDFVAQLAQFSSLQSSQTMQSDLASLQANNLLGRTVSVNTTSGSLITGLVSAVQMQSGTPSIVINGQSYDLSQIAAVAPTVAATTPSN
jgi:flagellar basal-body rod modification protein FlgD